MLDPTVLVHVYDRRGENAPSRCAQELPPLRNLLLALVAKVHVDSLVTSAFAHRKAGHLFRHSRDTQCQRDSSYAVSHARQVGTDAAGNNTTFSIRIVP